MPAQRGMPSLTRRVGDVSIFNIMSQDFSIRRIHAREVLDSRGRPTVEVEVHCPSGSGRAIVPSGASTGRHEALELRDGDAGRYGGLGVRRAVANVHEIIAPRLLGLPVTEQALIDETLQKLDGTLNLSRLGANAILGVSLATAHAAAAAKQMPLWRYLNCLSQLAHKPKAQAKDESHEPEASATESLGSASGLCHVSDRSPSLPMPMVNLISGGLHAGGNLDMQDFLLLPVGARSYSEALAMAVSVHRTLGELLRQEGLDGYLIADEGGYGPKLKDNVQAIEFCLRAMDKAGCVPGKDTALAIDVAASHFYRDGYYHVRDCPEPLSPEATVALLAGWVRTYPVWSIEDGLAEDDWTGWANLTSALGANVQLIGDDLFCTNPERVKRGIDSRVANSVLVKPNQVGTLTQTLEVVKLAREAGYRPVISARSGETEDTTIADLAVGLAAGQIKIGSVTRGERLAKYNQLLRIEEEVKVFSGWRSRDL
jgi:enolase